MPIYCLKYLQFMKIIQNNIDTLNVHFKNHMISYFINNSSKYI